MSTTNDFNLNALISKIITQAFDDYKYYFKRSVENKALHPRTVYTINKNLREYEDFFKSNYCLRLCDYMDVGVENPGDFLMKKAQQEVLAELS